MVPKEHTKDRTSRSSSSKGSSSKKKRSTSKSGKRGSPSSPATISRDQLLYELQQDNAFFDSLVDLIPAKLYVSKANDDSYNPKYLKTPTNATSSAALKQARRDKHQQAKRNKLDPSTAESTTQLKKRLDQEEQDHHHNTKKGGIIPPGASGSTSSSKRKKEGTTEKKTSLTDATPVTPPLVSNQSRIEALRAKLHAKLAEKKQHSNSKNSDDPSQVSKRAARRADKRKRQEDAKQRKQNKRKASSKAETSNATMNDGRYRISASGAAALNDRATDLAHVDFGPLRGLNDTQDQQYQKTNKSLANLSKTKNLQKLLADADDKQEQLKLLRKGTKDEQAKAASMEWGDALKEAAGTRVKQDPAKLKQQMKRLATKKSKSQKAWKTRMEQTKSKKDERQTIRSHNLQQRKQGGSAGANLSHKRINKNGDTGEDGKTRRLSRPGFEGRKQGFLNGNGNAGGGGKTQ